MGPRLHVVAVQAAGGCAHKGKVAAAADAHRCDLSCCLSPHSLRPMLRKINKWIKGCGLSTLRSLQMHHRDYAQPQAQAQKCGFSTLHLLEWH